MFGTKEVIQIWGNEITYVTSLPAEHMPGTHWLHPHRHGSTAIQVAGGAALALIVKDPAGTLPSQVEGAPEVLLVVMQIDLEMSSRMASRARDSWFSITGGSLTSLVNGEVTPSISIKAGEWTRFRVIYAGWLAEMLSFQITGCEMVLLAKDGIYIRDFPRTLTAAAPIPTGGRADLMIRCPAASSNIPSHLGWTDHCNGDHRSWDCIQCWFWSMDSKLSHLSSGSSNYGGIWKLYLWHQVRQRTGEWWHVWIWSCATWELPGGSGWA